MWKKKKKKRGKERLFKGNKTGGKDCDEKFPRREEAQTVRKKKKKKQQTLGGEPLLRYQKKRPYWRRKKLTQKGKSAKGEIHKSKKPHWTVGFLCERGVPRGKTTRKETYQTKKKKSGLRKGRTLASTERRLWEEETAITRGEKTSRGEKSRDHADTHHERDGGAVRKKKGYTKGSRAKIAERGGEKAKKNGGKQDCKKSSWERTKGRGV